MNPHANPDAVFSPPPAFQGYDTPAVVPLGVHNSRPPKGKKANKGSTRKQAIDAGKTVNYESVVKLVAAKMMSNAKDEDGLIKSLNRYNKLVEGYDKTVTAAKEEAKAKVEAEIATERADVEEIKKLWAEKLEAVKSRETSLAQMQSLVAESKEQYTQLNAHVIEDKASLEKTTMEFVTEMEEGRKEIRNIRDNWLDTLASCKERERKLKEYRGHGKGAR